MVGVKHWENIGNHLPLYYVTLPHSCMPEPKFPSFAFWSSEVHKLLNELDSFGCTDPIGFFPQFYRTVSKPLVPKLSISFRNLLPHSCFPASRHTANVMPIPKTSASVLPEDYTPISITLILCKMFEQLLAKRFTTFLDSNNILPPHQLGCRKILSTCNAL